MKKTEVAKKMYRKVSDYTGDASNSEGWKQFSKEHSVSERKPFLKSVVRHIKQSQKGKASLYTPKGAKNEGETMTLGRKGNEEPRA